MSILLLHNAAVLDADAASIDAERRRLAEGAKNAVPVEVIDAAAWDMLRRLSEAGVLAFTGGTPRVLHQAAPTASEALLFTFIAGSPQTDKNAGPPTHTWTGKVRECRGAGRVRLSRIRGMPAAGNIA